MNKIMLKSEILNNIAENSTVAIYGAGTLGIRLFEYIQNNRKDIKITFFIDKNLPQREIKTYDIESARDFLVNVDAVLIAAIPPNSDEMEQQLEKYGVQKYYKLFSRENKILVKKPCHKEGLFVRENGDIYPCCSVWGFEKYKIGHLDDENLFEKIDLFSEKCTCADFELIKGDFKSLDRRYKMLNIELSYICQAKCAMCCTKSPDIKEGYCFNNYEKLEKLIAKTMPELIVVQGGEILIQPKSLEFIEKIKEKYGSAFRLVTNGNNVAKIEQVKKLFSSVSVSFVGFSPQTYKTIMGLDVEKTKEFCTEILKTKSLGVCLKYLLSPINIHELPNFIEWALSFENLDEIVIHDSNCRQYINLNTDDNYWNKIAQRTKKDISKVIKSAKNNGVMLPPIGIDETSSTLLGVIEEDFI